MKKLRSFFFLPLVFCIESSAFVFEEPLPVEIRYVAELKERGSAPAAPAEWSMSMNFLEGAEAPCSFSLTGKPRVYCDQADCVTAPDTFYITEVPEVSRCGTIYRAKKLSCGSYPLLPGCVPKESEGMEYPTIQVIENRAQDCAGEQSDERSPSDWVVTVTYRDGTTLELFGTPRLP
jgi:hypothetical protein